MAYSDHLLSYRMESTEDLLTEKAALKTQRTIFISQNMGTKGFTRDLRLLEDRLQAVNYVLRSRGYTFVPEPTVVSPSVGITNFQDIQ